MSHSQSHSQVEDRSFAVRYDSLPLMVYREIAAHLRCLPGVEVELEWNSSSTFRYLDSQIGALLIRQSAGSDPVQLTQILDHYGLWQQTSDPSEDLS